MSDLNHAHLDTTTAYRLARREQGRAMAAAFRRLRRRLHRA